MFDIVVVLVGLGSLTLTIEGYGEHAQDRNHYSASYPDDEDLGHNLYKFRNANRELETQDFISEKDNNKYPRNYLGDSRKRRHVYSRMDEEFFGIDDELSGKGEFSSNAYTTGDNKVYDHSDREKEFDPGYNHPYRGKEDLNWKEPHDTEKANHAKNGVTNHDLETYAYGRNNIGWTDRKYHADSGTTDSDYGHRKNDNANKRYLQKNIGFGETSSKGSPGGYDSQYGKPDVYEYSDYKGPKGEYDNWYGEEDVERQGGSTRRKSDHTQSSYFGKHEDNDNTYGDFGQGRSYRTGHNQRKELTARDVRDAVDRYSLKHSQYIDYKPKDWQRHGYDSRDGGHYQSSGGRYGTKQVNGWRESTKRDYRKKNPHDHGHRYLIVGKDFDNYHKDSENRNGGYENQHSGSGNERGKHNYRRYNYKEHSSPWYGQKRVSLNNKENNWRIDPKDIEDKNKDYNWNDFNRRTRNKAENGRSGYTQNSEKPLTMAHLRTEKDGGRAIAIYGVESMPRGLAEYGDLDFESPVQNPYRPRRSSKERGSVYGSTLMRYDDNIGNFGNPDFAGSAEYIENGQYYE